MKWKADKMIEVENLSKRYGEKLAVDGVSFVIQPGIVTGFLGPNGAGKSTTMRMIAGLDEPTAGQVVVNGRSPGTRVLMENARPRLTCEAACPRVTMRDRRHRVNGRLTAQVMKPRTR
jgi:ABC-type multidrug transport system ATPase subunit